MSSLKNFSEQQGFELIAQNLDILNGCIDQLNDNPENEKMYGWCSRAAGSLFSIRENVRALERSLAEECAEVHGSEKE